MDYTEHRYQSHDDLSLYYRSYGSGGEVVLCLPGLTRNSKDFHDLATHLAPRYRVVCLDLRGRGKSEWAKKWRHYHPGVYVRDIWKLVDQLGVSRFIIVGTSLGGLLAMIMAAQNPQRLKAIVLNDIGPEIDPVGYKRILSSAGRQLKVKNWQEAARQCRDTYHLALPGMSSDFWDAFARRSYRENTSGVPEPDMDPKIGHAIRHGSLPGKILLWLRKLGILHQVSGVPLDPWDAFRAVSMPCLVLRGNLSDVLSERIVERMLAIKPDLQRVTIPDRGHVPLLDEAESLNAIDAFLQQLVQPTS